MSTSGLGGRAEAEIAAALEDLRTLLKNPDVGARLADLGVNVALALVAADGLEAYLRGDKARALEDLGTAVDEIAGRLAVGSSAEA